MCCQPDFGIWEFPRACDPSVVIASEGQSWDPDPGPSPRRAKLGKALLSSTSSTGNCWFVYNLRSFILLNLTSKISFFIIEEECEHVLDFKDSSSTQAFIIKSESPCPVSPANPILSLLWGWKAFTSPSPGSSCKWADHFLRTLSTTDLYLCVVALLCEEGQLYDAFWS